jgi:hypothetical protein
MGLEPGGGCPAPRPAQSHRRLPPEAAVLKRFGREREREREREEVGWVEEREREGGRKTPVGMDCQRGREREDLGQGTWAARLTSGAERNRSVQSQHAEASPARGEEQVCGGGRDGCGAVANTCGSEERMRG